MSRINWKEEELRSIAKLILSAKDYQEIMQKLNGTRMGLTNKYGKIKRLDLMAAWINEFR